MLYFIKSNGFVKIGYAKNIDKRMKQYYTHNPDFQLLDSIDGELQEEKFLHKILKNYQFRTEWFYDVPEVYSIWNSFKQCKIDIMSVPTKLNNFDIILLNILGSNLIKEDNKYIVNFTFNLIKNCAKQIKVKIKDISQVIENYIELKWIIPYKGQYKIFNIESINKYLNNDPLKFDIEEGRLIAYAIEYQGSK